MTSSTKKKIGRRDTKGARKPTRTAANDTLDVRDWVGDVATAHRLLAEIGPFSQQVAEWGPRALGHVRYYAFVMMDATHCHASKHMREMVLDHLAGAVRASRGTSVAS
jgi:hypothetical protein